MRSAGNRSRANEAEPPEPTLQEILEALTNSAEMPLAGISTLPQTCAMCRLVTQSVVRGIRSLFAEFVNDPDSRLRLRAARGFCREHTEMVAATSDALGIAILYADLADLTEERWKRPTTATPKGQAASILRRLRATPDTACPACKLHMEAGSRYVDALAAGLNGSQRSAVLERLSEGAGLCVHHVERVDIATASTARAQFREIQVEKMAKLRLELAEIIRKNDYRFRGETWGEERDAWIRALNRLTRP